MYVQANKDESIKNEALYYFSQMEAKDEESLRMWELFKSLSIKDLESVYDVNNIFYIKKKFKFFYFNLTNLKKNANLKETRYKI